MINKINYLYISTISNIHTSLLKLFNETHNPIIMPNYLTEKDKTKERKS